MYKAQEDVEDGDEDVEDGGGGGKDDQVRCRQGWDAGQSLQEGLLVSLGCPTYKNRSKIKIPQFANCRYYGLLKSNAFAKTFTAYIILLQIVTFETCPNSPMIFIASCA